MLRGQCELDQFVEGLNTYGILDMIREHPQHMEPLLVAHQSQLNKGVLHSLVGSVTNVLRS